ncbi:hypothetical protein IAT38_007486 [Cryptococcus sp. DSM 104549]
MLDLYITPRHGNAGGRFFPHTGHLGVSPVVVQGKIATKLPPVCDPLLVKSITLRIKCIESRAGGAFEGDVDNTLWEKAKVLLAPPPGEEYTGVGDWDSMFKLAIPVEAAAAGRSAMVIREYKVVWRFEVVIEHKPIPYVGTSITKAFALDLANYRSPSLAPLSPPSPIIVGSDTLASEVCITPPHGAYGPGDSFNVGVQVKPRYDGVAVKKVSVVLERRIELVDTKASARSASAHQEGAPVKRRQLSSSNRSNSPSPPNKISSLFRRSISPRPPFHRIPSPADNIPITSPGAGFTQEPETLSAHYAPVIRDKITESTSTELEPGSAGSSSSTRCTVSIALPRRTGKWALGETHQTNLVCMSYVLKASITLKGERRSSSAKTFVCAPVPVVLVSRSAAERAEAVAALEHPKRRAHAHSAAQKGSSGHGHRSSLYLHEAPSEVVGESVPGLGLGGFSTHALSPITGVATNVKPILRSAGGEPGQQQQPSISFALPSAPSHATSAGSGALPINSLLNPETTRTAATPTITPSSSTATIVPSSPPNTQLLSPPPTSSGFPPPPLSTSSRPASSRTSSSSTSTSTSAPAPARPSFDAANDPETREIFHHFISHASGRRISSTTSDEEDEPSRSRQKLASGHRATPFLPQQDGRRSSQGPLPSLDTLGFGLPHVPDQGRPRSRPRTAPVHSAFAMTHSSGAGAGAGAGGEAGPCPLSGFGAGGGSKPLTSLGFGPRAGRRPVTSAGRVGSPHGEEEGDQFAFALPREAGARSND